MLRVSGLLIVALLARTDSVCSAEPAADPIGFFDLRYARQIDASKPEQVRMAWDHCHAVATLQGVVVVDARSPSVDMTASSRSSQAAIADRGALSGAAPRKVKKTAKKKATPKRKTPAKKAPPRLRRRW